MTKIDIFNRIFNKLNFNHILNIIYRDLVNALQKQIPHESEFPIALRYQLISATLVRVKYVKTKYENLVKT